MDPKHIPSKIIKCGPVGPLSRYIEPYVALLREEGYAPASLHEHVRVIVMFSQSLQRSGCEIRDLDEAVVERFLYHELKERWPQICAPATSAIGNAAPDGRDARQTDRAAKSCATAHGRLLAFSPDRTIALSGDGKGLAAIH
jgi:hypothetical protein